MAVWPSKAVHDKSHAPDPGVHQPSHLQESASDRIPDWASSPCRLPGPVTRCETCLRRALTAATVSSTPFRAPKVCAGQSVPGGGRRGCLGDSGQWGCSEQRKTRSPEDSSTIARGVELLVLPKASQCGVDHSRGGAVSPRSLCPGLDRGSHGVSGSKLVRVGRRRATPIGGSGRSAGSWGPARQGALGRGVWVSAL